MTLSLGEEIITMSFPETVRPLLVSRAATDPAAARLLEMFIRADESLSEQIGDRGTPKLAGSVPRPQVNHGH